MKIHGKMSLEERRYLFEWGLLLVGAAAGLTLAWVLAGFEWSFPGELERARELGIVSITTISGYPKSRDLIGYGLSLGLPAAGALLFWLAGRGSSDLGKDTLAGGFTTPTRSMWLVVALSLFASVYFSWNVTAMLDMRWNQYVGLWLFLGEQGATLAWVQSIMTGGIFGRDFFSLYGPMFVYPLAWIMEWVGYTAIAERAYKLLLDVVATGLLGFVLAKTLRSKWLAVGFVLLVCMVYPAQYFPSANTTILRIVLPLLPIVFVALWMESRKGSMLVAGGLLMGQSLLFSHESAFCAVLAIAAMFLIDQGGGKTAFFVKLRASAIFLAMAVLSMAPMVGFLLLNGAGSGLLDTVFGYPKTVMLGFGGLPFPSVRDWLGGDFHRNWLHYAVIAVYSATLVALCIARLRGGRSARFLWALGLLVYGTLLFRIALGRSKDIQTTKVMIPAIILTALWVDDLWVSWRQNRGAIVRSAWTLTLLFVLLVNFVGICLNPYSRYRIAEAWKYAFTMDGKFSVANINGVALPDLPRVGIFVNERTAHHLREIGRFLDENTKPRDYVYFFPNEAVYYFLFDRTNPTRYPIAYFATPFERQREVIRDLEKNRPRYVLYSRNTWRVDYIREEMQIPIIVQYLKARYRTVKKMDGADVLERIADR